MSSVGDFSTYYFDKSHHRPLFLLSPTLSLPIPVPEAIDAYINASKTVLKQGEPLTVNCTVHGVELVFFSWDIPNREVSRSGAERALCSAFPPRPLSGLMAEPRLHQDVETHLNFYPLKFLS